MCFKMIVSLKNFYHTKQRNNLKIVEEKKRYFRYFSWINEYNPQKQQH